MWPSAFWLINAGNKNNMKAFDNITKSSGPPRRYEPLLN